MEKKPLRKKVMNRVLKALGWVLLITFSINIAYSFFAVAGTKHSIAEIVWQIVYSVLMIWLGAWLVRRKEKPSQPPAGMWTNTVLKVLLTIEGFIFIPMELVTTSLIGLTFLIPLWLPIYLFLMTIIWFPFGLYIMSTSWLYQKVFVLRPILAIISIPILVILDCFLTLMANPDRADKYNKALIIDSWPFSSWSDIKNMDFMDEWRGMSFAIGKARESKKPWEQERVKHTSLLKKTGNNYVGNKKTRVYHNPDCYLAQQISHKNVVWFASQVDAADEHYIPCKLCPTIQGEELQECLTYYEQELKLKAFQEKEDGRYLIDGVILVSHKYKPTDRYKPAKRVAESAKGILNQRCKMTSMPNIAPAMYSAWQTAYEDYAAYTQARAESLEAAANGRRLLNDPSASLYFKCDKSRRKAEIEEKKFLRRLNVSAHEVQKLRSDVSATITTENWQPE